jgi:hypothetical protein
MKVSLAIVALLFSFANAKAEERSPDAELMIGVNDTSLVILSDHATEDDREPGEIHSGVYYNARNRVEVQILRSGRISSNIVITSSESVHQFPVSFPDRLRESRYGWETRGYFTKAFATTAGVIYCDYPVYLTLNFLEEGEFVEAEIEYPSYATLSTFGQCLSGPNRREFFEMQRDPENRQ